MGERMGERKRKERKERERENNSRTSIWSISECTEADIQSYFEDGGGVINKKYPTMDKHIKKAINLAAYGPNIHNPPKFLNWTKIKTCLLRTEYSSYVSEHEELVRRRVTYLMGQKILGFTAEVAVRENRASGKKKKQMRYYLPASGTTEGDDYYFHIPLIYLSSSILLHTVINNITLQNL
jgi:hypothetical protein